MKNYGIIGIGNAGNQIASLANEKLQMDAIAINSSERDLDTITNPNVIKKIIGDSKGAGKNRTEAKAFLKGSVIEMITSEDFVEFMKEKEYVIVVSSTGGGTGSGTAPVFEEILKQSNPNVNFILIAVLPTLSEALSTQVNTLEYLKELYEASSDTTYMLYDNEKASHLPSYEMMDTINAAIVEDLRVLTGEYNYPTKYASIDEKDMSVILTTSGRLMVAGVTKGLDEKTLDTKAIDDLVIDDFKKNYHAEYNRDKVIMRMGIISVLDEDVNKLFDGELQKVQDTIGTPVETFNHIAINEHPEVNNRIYVIAAGMTRADDRMKKITERIDAINAAQEKIKKANNALSGVDLDALNAKKQLKEKGEVGDKCDLTNIFSKFGF